MTVKRRILSLLLALCLIASLLIPVQAADLTAQQIAQLYSVVLSDATLRPNTEKPVQLFDLTGDGAPELILMCRGKSGGELQIWTCRDSRAVKVLSLNWVEVSASKHWLYLRKDGTVAWYYTNSGYDYPYASIYHQGTCYVWDGSAFVQTQHYEYNYKDNGAGSVIPTSASENGQSVSTARGKALDDAFLANVSRTLMTPMNGAPGAMTGREAQTYLGSVRGRFFDVPSGKYYTDAVNWAVNNGITQGASAYAFSPDAPCTRAQAVTFLWRAAGQPEPKQKTTSFTDVNSGAF